MQASEVQVGMKVETKDLKVVGDFRFPLPAACCNSRKDGAQGTVSGEFENHFGLKDLWVVRHEDGATAIYGSKELTPLTN